MSKIAEKANSLPKLAQHIGVKEENFIGAGTFNNAYKFNYVSVMTTSGKRYMGPLILKNRKVTDETNENSLLDTPERSVRLYQEINPDQFSALTHDETMWVSQYVSETEASDEEIAKTLIDIYRRTDRLIMDAYAAGNFMTSTSSDGKIEETICIDVGQAKGARSESFSSKTALASLLNKDEFLNEINDSDYSPNTCLAIKTILLLEKAYLQEKNPETIPRCLLKEEIISYIGNQIKKGFDDDSGRLLEEMCSETRSEKSCRIAAAIIINTLLMFICLTLVGIAIAAPLFCEHKRLTGKKFGLFYSEHKTLTAVRLAITKLKALNPGQS